MRKLLLSIFMMVAVVATAFGQTVTFNFTEAGDDGKIYGYNVPTTGENGAVNLGDGGTLKNSNVVITYAQGTAGTQGRLWLNGSTPEIRTYSGSSFTFTTTDGSKITSIKFTEIGRASCRERV